MKFYTIALFLSVLPLCADAMMADGLSDKRKRPRSGSRGDYGDCIEYVQIVRRPEKNTQNAQAPQSNLIKK